uniref:Uncharacterized protein n=1 Tax=Anabas testudineus TaxID=64144 RepID=A0A3Q1I645_ANATE
PNLVCLDLRSPVKLLRSSLRLCCDDTALFAVVIYLYVQLHTHMQAGEHAHLDLHPHTSTHTVHTPAACPAPAQRSLICVWLLSCGAPLSLLISASAEEVFQETTPTHFQGRKLCSLYVWSSHQITFSE